MFFVCKKNVSFVRGLLLLLLLLLFMLLLLLLLLLLLMLQQLLQGTVLGGDSEIIAS